MGYFKTSLHVWMVGFEGVGICKGRILVDGELLYAGKVNHVTT